MNKLLLDGTGIFGKTKYWIMKDDRLYESISMRLLENTVNDLNIKNDKVILEYED